MSYRDANGRRVVITGMGVVSPSGIGADEFWANLKAGKSSIAPFELLTYSAAPRNVGGEVKGFTEETAKKQYLKDQRKSIKVMCREIQLGVASATLAIGHSGLNLDTISHERFGVDFGANLMFSPPDVLSDACGLCVDDERKFHFDQWGETGLKGMEPLWLLRYLPNMPACHIGISADARGPSNSITLDDASGNLALGEAFDVILRDRADIMIAGTTGTRVHPVKTMHAYLWDGLADSSDPPETWCRPFDKNRIGQVVGEGACSFILEEESLAKSRGARIFATILGAGASCVLDKDGRPHIRQALVNAMRSALRDAGLSPADIGHINAHGQATKAEDIEEAAAIRDVFGDLASKVPVTALKGYFGNSGSGAGTIELAGSLLGLAEGVVPATANFHTPDPDCPLNIVHGQPLAVENRTVMKLSYTRLGQASVLIARGA